MDALNLLKADYRAKLDGELRYVERELAGQQVRFYYRPVNMATLGKIRRVSERDTAEGVMMSFIQRARDQHGKRLFRDADLTEMMKTTDADLVADIVAEMSTAAPEDDEALEADTDRKPHQASAAADSSLALQTS